MKSVSKLKFCNYNIMSQELKLLKTVRDELYYEMTIGIASGKLTNQQVKKLSEIAGEASALIDLLEARAPDITPVGFEVPDVLLTQYKLSPELKTILRARIKQQLPLSRRLRNN